MQLRTQVGKMANEASGAREREKVLEESLAKSEHALKEESARRAKAIEIRNTAVDEAKELRVKAAGLKDELRRAAAAPRLAAKGASRRTSVGSATSSD